MNDIVNDNISIYYNMTYNTINDDFMEGDDTTTIIILAVFTGFIIFCVFCNRNEERDREDMKERASRAQRRLEIRIVG